MYSIQRLIENPKITRVKSATAPAGFSIEIRRDDKGNPTHFIQHTANGPLEPEKYHQFHPIMLSQSANWTELEVPTVETPKKSKYSKK